MCKSSMRKSVHGLAMLAATAITLAAPSVLQAQNAGGSHGKGGSMMDSGTMNMMGRMDQMMDHCNQMMQGARGESGKPDEQGRDRAAPADDSTKKKQ